MNFSRESFDTNLNAAKPEYGNMLTKGINLPYMPTPDNILTYADKFVHFMGKIKSIELDYAVSSLAVVDAVLEGFYSRKESPDQNALMLFSIGCYIGEVIGRKCNGKWMNARDCDWPERVTSMAVVMKLPSGLFIDPIAKAYRRSYYGDAESIGVYYMELVSANS